MAVDVDDLHAPAADRDLTPRLLGAQAVEPGARTNAPAAPATVRQKARLLVMVVSLMARLRRLALGGRTLLPVEDGVKYAAILLDIYRPRFYWYVLHSRKGARDRGQGRRL